MRSRVIPGSLVTIERRVPVSRLNNVDLPTLGRPTITSDGSFSFIRSFIRIGRLLRRLKRDAATVLEYSSVADAALVHRPPKRSFTKPARVFETVQFR